MERLATTILLVSVISSNLVFSYNGGCQTTQYIELGTRGILKCTFDQDSLGVFWYNTTDYMQDKPIIYFKDSVVSGEGYRSREFDIDTNGSLIINTVSFKHEQYFTVVWINIEKSYIPHFIDAVVTVEPQEPFPTISGCGNETLCFRKNCTPFFIQCDIRNARPAISLEWFERTIHGDRRVSSQQMTLFPKNELFSTQVKASNLNADNTTLIKIYVCKATGSERSLRVKESVIFISNCRLNYPLHRSTKSYIRQNSRLLLPCTSKHIVYVSWKKISPSYILQNLIDAVFVKDISVHNYSEKYLLSGNNSLSLNHVNVQHEGQYACIFGDGTKEEIISYNVLVYGTC